MGIKQETKMATTTTADDAVILAAEQEIAALLARFHAIGGDAVDEDEDNRIWKRVWDLEKMIAKAPPATLAGAAVKLRRLLDPVLGMEIGENDGDIPCLRQILTLLEHLAGSS
jgi:hypothetical protein